MTYSLTLQGLAIAVVGTIIKAGGSDMPHDQVAAWVATTVQIVGALIAYYGRVRQGDITWYGAKKQ